MELQLDEALDENTSTYPVINLKPKQKIPQTWKFNVPGNDTLMGRMVSFASEGDAVKNVKMGDKYVQFFLLSLTSKGNATELKGGLGSDPRGTVATIFDTVYQSVIRCRFDAVLFRLPIRKLKGQHKAVQRILSRMMEQRTGGRYVVLKEMWDYSSKYAYVLVKRKSVLLEDIPGLPKVSDELFTKVETQVGTTYVDKKTGQTVDKDTAFAASIAELEDNRSSDRAIAAKIRISRREIMLAQYGDMESTKDWKSENIDKLEQLSAAPPLVQSEGEPNKSVENIFKNLKNTVSDKNDQMEQSFDKFKNASSEDRVFNKEFNIYGNIYSDARRLIKSIYKENTLSDTPRIIEARDKMIMQVLDNYIKSIKKFNGNNYLEVYKGLSDIVIDSYGEKELSSEERDSYIKQIILSFTNNAEKETGKMYKLYGKELAGDLDENTPEGKAVKKYCYLGYDKINDFLIGQKYYNIISDIESMDNAFNKGVKLPNNTKLFRGMSFNKENYDKMIKNKIFYFNNFVSTSLAPVFAGMYGNTVSALDTEKGVNDFDIDSNSSEAQPTIINKFAQVGFVIGGAEKIKVVIPGELSTYPEECEVILPRGTAIKINKVWIGGPDLPVTKSVIESTVIAPDQIDESTELYDGDALINEGVVKRLNFLSFLKEESESTYEDEVDDEEFFAPVVQVKKTVVEYDPVMSIVASMIDLDQLPAKFR